MRFQIEGMSRIGDRLRQEMDQYGKTVSFEKGDTIFDYDETLNYFYFILSGKVKIYHMNLNNSKEQTIYLLTRGDMYDTVTLLDGKPHDMMSEVLESGEAFRVPIGKTREWMYDYPVFGEIILKYVASQMREVEELAADLTLLDTKERLIKLILKNIEKSKERGVNILENLSNAEIAKLIGTVRHVIDRHIKLLKSEGMIDKSRRKISLKDMERLRDELEDYV